MISIEMQVQKTCKGRATNTSEKEWQSMARRCVAESLGDCSGGISKEHVINKGVIDLLDGFFEVEKWPGVEQGRPQFRHGYSLQARVFCRKHNGGMGKLDQTGTQLCWALLEGFNGKAPASGIKGLDLERWVLKVFCGYLAAGVADENGTTRRFDPPTAWIDVLFGCVDESGIGLGFSHATDSRDIFFIPFLDDDQSPIGGFLDFLGLRMALIPGDPNPVALQRDDNGELAVMTHRPHALEFDLGGSAVILPIDWHGKPAADQFRYTVKAIV